MARAKSGQDRRRIGEVPPERPIGVSPPLRPVARVPNGDALAHVPPQHAPAVHVAHPPPPHAVGAPPNPRKPKLVRDVRGGVLGDLFEVFPDLPWPPRPKARLPVARPGRRLVEHRIHLTTIKRPSDGWTWAGGSRR